MAEKSDSPKIMDVVHPGKSIQPNTSRPVIVTNRPMIAEDPMITQTAKLAVERRKASELMAKKIETPEASDIHLGKTMSPVGDGEKTEPAATEEPTAVASEKVPGEEPKDKKQSAIEEEPTTKTAPVEEKTDDVKPAPPSERPVAQFADIKTSVDVSETEPKPDAAVAIDSEETTTAKAAINDAVAEKRQAELDLLISTGKYNVPIGQQAHRRHARILAGTLAIVFLMALLANFMLDAGIVTISGVPHTDFFDL